MVKQEIFIVENQILLFLFDKKSIQQNYEYHFFVQSAVHVQLYYIFLHAQDLDIKIYLHIQHDDAHIQLFGLYALSEKESLKIHTFQNHEQKNAQSFVHIKGIVLKYAQCDFYGMIDIAKSAQGTQAHMEHKAIVLDSTARVSAQPMIQVHTNNVSCGHGSASGPLDQEQIYFLMARGISYQAAKKIVLRAFFEEILAGHPDKNSILAIIEEKILGGSDEL